MGSFLCFFHVGILVSLAFHSNGLSLLTLFSLFHMLRSFRLAFGASLKMFSHNAGALWSLRKPDFRVNLGAQLGTALNSLRFD